MSLPLFSLLTLMAAFQGIFSQVPEFFQIPSFSCQGRLPGYYGDLETGCRAYHICDGFNQFTYVCPPRTLFRARDRACDHFFLVDCEETPFGVLGRGRESPERIPLRERISVNQHGGNFASETKTGRSRVRDTISVTGTSTSTGSRTNTGTSTVTNTPTSTSTSIGTSTVTNTPTSTSTSIGTSTVTSPSTTIGLTGTGPQSIEPIPRSLPSGPETELSTESSEINTTTTASENEKVPSTESNSNGIEEDETKESKSDYLKLKLNDFRFLFFIPEIENGNSIVPENPRELILPVKRYFLIRFRKPEVGIVNSQCPDRCDPSFLVSGTCHPCIMIR